MNKQQKEETKRRVAESDELAKAVAAEVAEHAKRIANGSRRQLWDTWAADAVLFRRHRS